MPESCEGHGNRDVLPDQSALLCDIVPISHAELQQLRQDRDDLRHALQWACSYIADDEPEGGEQREDYTGATRVAWPDDPEQWAPEDFAGASDEGEASRG